jgi:ABC-2 type transport system ATP-binding protein
VCDWLVLIEKGRSLYQGPTHSLLDGVARGLVVVPERPADHASLVGILRASGHRVADGDDRLVVDVDGDVAGVAAAVNRSAFDAGIVLVELSPQRTTLEDRYLSMVQGGSR